MWTTPFCHHEIHLYRNYSDATTPNRNELFCLWFEGWIVLFNVSTDVRVTQFCSIKIINKWNECWNTFYSISHLAFWRLPQPNWHSPFGYLIALFIELAAAFAMLFSVLTIICLLVGSCWLFIAFVEDIINDLTQLKIDEKSNATDREMKTCFSNIIQFYSDAKQLSLNLIA